ncbi:FAD-dependent oxidoreductase [Vibrio tapetis subsp. quintayensis]|uniref:NAD(P)/FAD-dependent oxidoreductase n=1 Tax=Vibrio tapetis TaxID=52443 RepID=UPI0025B49110|nr:FAD-dependent oxidoreductase [Vibrio tapetis]MDN3682844.1 FAD-dependent oxidoreductase [Vibrio tapetis subsp. quintayensis]
MKNIAIIGSGISGLTCAYLLDAHNKVTVFEKNQYVGGHTATVDIEHQGTQYAIDTGFIVFNDRTYPNFNLLLAQLGITRQKTEMSFSVHNKQTKFEYNGHGINSLFAQRSNLFKPKFWRLISEIIKFNKLCKQAFRSNNIEAKSTLGEFLAQHNFSAFFSEHYILPMGAAIWSTSLEEMGKFELKFFIQFFYHHGLLNITDRPQWYVVPGGSRVYVNAIQSKLSKPIITGANIKHVKRLDMGVEVIMENGDAQLFDDVIFACHSDQALRLLADPTELEVDVLSGIPYSRNEVVLHTDTRLLPDRKLAWASWNYMLDGNLSRPSCVTYNMNILQGIRSQDTFCVTLNQSEAIDKNKIIRSFVYHHPVLDQSSVIAQKKRDLICGKNGCHFVGAYWYSGFHEDGVRSALDVTKRFGQSL